jgi:hypothetical protein
VRRVRCGCCEPATHEAECRGVHGACRVVELVRKGEKPVNRAGLQPVTSTVGKYDMRFPRDTPGNLILRTIFSHWWIGQREEKEKENRCQESDHFFMSITSLALTNPHAAASPDPPALGQSREMWLPKVKSPLESEGLKARKPHPSDPHV